LAQTSIISLKMQKHPVNARWKRLSQLSLIEQRFFYKNSRISSNLNKNKILKCWIKIWNRASVWYSPDQTFSVFFMPLCFWLTSAWCRPWGRSEQTLLRWWRSGRWRNKRTRRGNHSHRKRPRKLIQLLLILIKVPFAYLSKTE